MSFEKDRNDQCDHKETSTPKEELETANLGPRRPAVSTDQPEEDAGGPARQTDPVEPNGAGPTHYTPNPLEE